MKATLYFWSYGFFIVCLILLFNHKRTNDIQEVFWYIRFWGCLIISLLSYVGLIIYNKIENNELND